MCISLVGKCGFYIDTSAVRTFTPQLTTPTLVDGEDYLSVEQILEWHYDSANLTQCVSVPIINDECVEEKEEMFTVLLSSLKGCVLLGTNYTTVTILDDDRE